MKAIFMNFYLKDCLGVEFTAYDGRMMKEGALTSFTFNDA